MQGDPPHSPIPSKTWAFGVATAVVLLLTLLTWAFASPVGSALEDDLHIANIYCTHDSTTCRSQMWEWPTTPPSWNPDPAARTGPEYAGAKKAYPDLWKNQEPRALPCFVANGTTGRAPDPAVAADCLNAADPAATVPATVDDPRATTSPYYRFISVFTRDTIRESVATWRIINVLLTVALISIAVVLTAPRFRRAVAVGALAVVTPIGLFVTSSISPSAWVIAGTAAFSGPALSALREHEDRRQRITRIVFSAVALIFVLAGGGPGVALILVLVALVLGLQAPRLVYGIIAGGTALAAVLAAVLIASDTASVRSDLDWVSTGLGGAGQWEALAKVPGYLFGSEAYRLGWLEINPPAVAVIASQAAFWGVVILGLAVVFRRKALALLITTGLLFAVAIAMVAGRAQPPTPGELLPLVLLAAFIVLIPRWGEWMPRWTPAQWVGLAAALSLANTLALLFLTVRYTSGLRPGTTNPLAFASAATPDWWWGAWLSPFANWLVGSLVFVATISLLITRPSIVGTDEPSRA